MKHVRYTTPQVKSSFYRSSVADENSRRTPPSGLTSTCDMCLTESRDHIHDTQRGSRHGDEELHQELDETELDETIQKITSYKVAFLSPDPVTMYLSSLEMSQHRTDEDSLDYNAKHVWHHRFESQQAQVQKEIYNLTIRPNTDLSHKQQRMRKYRTTSARCKSFRTWNMLAPYGVLQAFSKLSFPVLTNHLPQLANLSDKTQLSCKWSWYLSGLEWCNTSTLLLSILQLTTTHTTTFIAVLLKSQYQV